MHGGSPNYSYFQLEYAHSLEVLKSCRSFRNGLKVLRVKSRVTLAGVESPIPGSREAGFIQFKCWLLIRFHFLNPSLRRLCYGVAWVVWGRSTERVRFRTGGGRVWWPLHPRRRSQRTFLTGAERSTTPARGKWVAAAAHWYWQQLVSSAWHGLLSWPSTCPACTVMSPSKGVSLNIYIIKRNFHQFTSNLRDVSHQPRSIHRWLIVCKISPLLLFPSSFVLFFVGNLRSIFWC